MTGSGAVGRGRANIVRSRRERRSQPKGAPDKGAPENFLLNKCARRGQDEMAAASYSSDVLQTFYGPVPREENRNLPEPQTPIPIGRYDGFQITQNNFQEWLRVWRMDVSLTNPNNKDLLRFARENKEKFTDLIEQEILKNNNVKVGLGLEREFSRERDGETQEMKHYFKNNQPYIFNRYDEEEPKYFF